MRACHGADTWLIKPIPSALMTIPPCKTARRLILSTSLPETNMQIADTIWNRPTAPPNSLRPQPNSSTIGFRVSPMAKRAPPLTKRRKTPAARTRAVFTLRDDFMKECRAVPASIHSEERLSHEALLAALGHENAPR